MSNKRTNNGVPLQQKDTAKGRKVSPWKKKFGDYLVDISKYVLTGVIISSLFSDMSESPVALYGIGLIIAVASLALGLSLINNNTKE